MPSRCGPARRPEMANAAPTCCATSSAPSPPSSISFANVRSISSLPTCRQGSPSSRNERLGRQPFDYLTTAKRLHVLKTNAPLWTRHDRGGKPGEPLSSHCYVRNLKRYAAEAGIDRFHLHQTRHTFARIVAEETGSITATQDALDHKNPATTRVYVQRIAVERDLYSGRVISRARRPSKSS